MFNPCTLLSLLFWLYSLVGAASAHDEFHSLTRAASNASLMWGTYRPNLYFGTRPRLPHSLMTGLLWYDAEDPEGWKHMRHQCDQNDGLKGFGYYKHDGRSFGMQKISDHPLGLELKTEFVKIPGGNHGGSWGARITGKPTGDGHPKVSMIFYVGLDGEGELDMADIPPSGQSLHTAAVVEGSTKDLGEFSVRVEDTNGKPSETQFIGMVTPDGQAWRAKEFIEAHFFQHVQSYIATSNEPLDDVSKLLRFDNQVRSNANMFAFQKVIDGPFQFDVYFTSKSAPHKLDAISISNHLKHAYSTFDERFEATFGLQAKGFDADKVEFGQYLLSNMLGGVGYFYGSSIVDASGIDEEEDADYEFSSGAVEKARRPVTTAPRSLFTATPSRPFFPRGFYWDEGFHQLLIGKWDNDLSLEIIENWYSLMDNDGWIAREQILGEEARSRVPEEFQVQFPHYANPPTLLMAVKAFVDRVEHAEHSLLHADQIGFQQPFVAMGGMDQLDSGVTRAHLDSVELARNYLARLYPKLRLNWQWFRETQRGEIKEWGREATSNREGYRWRGRTQGHCLTSGLDDYPRASPPHVAELHADLHSWMAFMTRLLKAIAERLGEEDDAAEYTKVEKNLIANLHDLHWSVENRVFCDLSVNEEEESIHVCHKGYLSLFPLMLGLLSHDDPKLDMLLDLIRSPEELWSSFGLLSLSKKDPQYYTGEIYWRGPIWINMNYMVLSSLYKNYINQPGPYQTKAREIYSSLRENLIQNVYKEFKRTGYPWEQYHAATGEGLRSHPFTGWTSLILLIMAENY
ncbi:uncharacterized protein VTP21DRAFT_10981 [Calcarisporiella thermophila]|uniref:uncharacterized protein n=1 Tax=Calcarisporiella thermophila TaxID=911321 RepID=UPI0037433ADD